jgi:hypothetical protein
MIFIVCLKFFQRGTRKTENFKAFVWRYFLEFIFENREEGVSTSDRHSDTYIIDELKDDFAG